MSATQIAAALFQLQQLDLELERVTAEQQAIVHSLQGDSTLQKLRAEHTTVQQQLRAGQQAQKEAEWALEDVNRRLAMQEQRLYSGTVTNPKELAALQQEVQRLRAQQSRQEEITLEMMESTESLQEMAQRKAKVLQQAEEDWAKGNVALMTRRDQLEARRQELQTKRTQLAVGIDVELLKRYDAMRRSKQGRAVSKVEQNSCQWCRVILTASELQRVRISNELQTCSNCGRILYYDR
jgi:uncharacterized protein